MRTAANILLLIVAVAAHVIWIRSLVEWDGSPCDAADCKYLPVLSGRKTERRINTMNETMTQIINAARHPLPITAGGALPRGTAQNARQPDSGTHNETAAK